MLTRAACLSSHEEGVGGVITQHHARFCVDSGDKGFGVMCDVWWVKARWGQGGRTAAEITSDAPRETLTPVGYESLGRTSYRPAARTQRRSALRPRRRTWWLTGSAAKSGTQRISVGGEKRRGMSKGLGRMKQKQTELNHIHNVNMCKYPKK